MHQCRGNARAPTLPAAVENQRDRSVLHRSYALSQCPTEQGPRRLLSTVERHTLWLVGPISQIASVFGRTSEMPGSTAWTDSDAIDPFPPSAIQSSCVAVFLFDQLVRAQQDRCRHIEAKRLGGRHIEHGLVFHRQLHRQIGRFSLLRMRST